MQKIRLAIMTIKVEVLGLVVSGELTASASDRLHRPAAPLIRVQRCYIDSIARYILGHAKSPTEP